MSAALRREQEERAQQLARRHQAQQQAQQLAQQKQQAKQRKRYGAPDANFIASLQSTNNDFLTRLGQAEARDTDRGGKWSGASHDKSDFRRQQHAGQNAVMTQLRAKAAPTTMPPIDASNWQQRSRSMGQQVSGGAARGF